MTSTRTPARTRARRRSWLTAVLVVAAFVAMAATRADAASYVPISGAGSTWSQNALDNWRRNVAQFGMSIAYAGTGSSDGRKQFANNTVDFAVSEIPYGTTDNGIRDDPPARGYAYMPIVAGGTSFMYNLKIGRTRVTQLRLSGETIAKIFTGNIRVWSDPAIKADNPGLKLPAVPVIPVVRSDGSGTTAQLATWLSKTFPSLWNAYCAKAGRSTPCGVTSNFPLAGGSAFTAQAGSLGVANYVANDSNVGTITYVEYSYALNLRFPVVKMLNASGYYVPPTASNVAVGLLRATVNENPSSPNYLTQNLEGVYSNPDRRAYPLSSYSYMIVPTKVEGSFSQAKGATLGAFAYYFLCGGQKDAPLLGYSPLPINLVQAGLRQVARIPGVVAQSIDIRKCANPTFSASGENLLAKTATYPAACDRKGPSQCGTTAGATSGGGTTSGSGSSGGAGGTGGTGGTVGRGATGGSGTGAVPGATGGSGTGAAPGAGAGGALPGAAPSVDPDTGQVLAGGDAGAGAQNPQAVPLTLASQNSDADRTLLMVVTGLFLLGAVLGPPLLSRRMGRGGEG